MYKNCKSNLRIHKLKVIIRVVHKKITKVIEVIANLHKN